MLKKCDVKGDRGNVLKIKDEEFMYILKVEGIV